MPSTNHEVPFTIQRRPSERKAAGRSGAAKRFQPQLVISSDDEALLERTELWLELLRNRLAEADERQMQDLIETALPSIEAPPAPAVLRQARRNALARTALLQEFGALSAEQVHELAGSKARNRFALATRWRQEGRTIGVSHRGKTYYPGFQFDANGQPLAVIGEVIAVFGCDPDGWQTALWFILANGWLGGQRPVDLLHSDPQAVVSAAQQETADAF